MKVTDRLRSHVAKAVQVSMQIEGYRRTGSKQTKDEAKRIMERESVEVSIPDKPMNQIFLAGLNLEG